MSLQGAGNYLVPNPILDLHNALITRMHFWNDDEALQTLAGRLYQACRNAPSLQAYQLAALNAAAAHSPACQWDFFNVIQAPLHNSIQNLSTQCQALEHNLYQQSVNIDGQIADAARARSQVLDLSNENQRLRSAISALEKRQAPSIPSAAAAATSSISKSVLMNPRGPAGRPPPGFDLQTQQTVYASPVAMRPKFTYP
jgi:hypothetical protein